MRRTAQARAMAAKKCFLQSNGLKAPWMASSRLATGIKCGSRRATCNIWPAPTHGVSLIARKCMQVPTTVVCNPIMTSGSTCSDGVQAIILMAPISTSLGRPVSRTATTMPTDKQPITCMTKQVKLTGATTRSAMVATKKTWVGGHYPILNGTTCLPKDKRPRMYAS